MMWTHRALYLLCLYLCVPCSLGAQAPYVFEGTSEDAYLGEHLELASDPDGEQTIDDLLLATFEQVGTKPIPDLGLSGTVHWFRFRLTNQSDTPDLLILVENPEIDEIDLFIAHGHTPVQFAKAGQRRPLDSQVQTTPDLAFPFHLAPGNEATIYGRVRNSRSLLLPLQVKTGSAMEAQSRSKNIFIGGYIGIMLVMAIYNLFVFISTRDKSYFLYVVYILLVGLTQLSFLGYSQFHFWPHWSDFSARSSLILTALTAIAASEFMRHFIHADEHLSWYRRWSGAFYAAFVLGMMLSFSGLDLIAYGTMQLVSTGFAVFLLYSAHTISRTGSGPAKFFLLAWSIFLVGVVLFVLKDWSIIPYNIITKYTMPLGSVLEVVLLSFGLADRINVLRREKEDSQAQALAASVENERIIREQNAILETKVKERTQALLASNEDLKRTQTQLVNAEKMASLGQLTAGIAHEINNPINFITSNVAPLRRNIEDIVSIMEGYRSVDVERAAEQLADLRDRAERLGLDESIAELDDIIASIAEGSSRTAEIVRGLRNFSRLDENDLKNADMNVGLRSTLTVLAPQYRNQVEFDLDLGELPMVECYPGKVNQVFMNILTNAVQATLARTDLHDRIVRIRTNTLENAVCISISDNGVGMTEEVKARMFDPFFTTKAVGEGTGLGMAIVYGIIQDHHGSIEVDSMPGAGSEFRIILPIRQQNVQLKRA